MRKKNNMKLSDYIADFLVEAGVKKVFVLSGGAAVHMIDSVSRNKNIDYICAQHEQHAGAEADGYSRISNNLGAAIVTSGPGGTNLATSIANAYFDSVPVLFLCGQVATFRLKKSKNLRQKGFQETDVVSIFQPITKYAKRILNPLDIAYELEKAVYLAKEGRPGPVLLDIPDDLGRAQIDLPKLKHFKQPTKVEVSKNLKQKIGKLFQLISSSMRPVIIYGAGVGIADSREKAIKFAEHFGIPAVRTYGGGDVMPSFHPLNIGTIGIAGCRSGNFALQTADLIIAVGTRLSPNVTGGKQNLFATHAKKVMVDIDPAEVNKFSKDEFLIDLPIIADARDFFEACERLYTHPQGDHGYRNWLKLIRSWEKKYPVCPVDYYKKNKEIQPHVFIKELAKLAKENDVIVADTGANLCWTLQAWETKKNQRIISAWSHTPMGYALPGAIGASFVGENNVLCLIGDGGLMLCLQELATVVRHKLPIKIFIFNNHGHSIQKQTLETWLSGKYEAVDEASGLSFPNFEKIGRAFGIPTVTLKHHKELKKRLSEILSAKGAVLVNVEIDPNARIVPMLKFGAGLEDLDPKLPREEIDEVMATVNR